MLSELTEKLNGLLSLVLEKREKNYKDLGTVYHLSDFFPYKWYDEEKGVYVSNDSVGIIFEILPLVGNSESMQRELSNIFTQILPEGSSIQVMFYADKNIGEILQDYVESREGASDTLHKLAKRKAEYLEKLATKSHLYPYVLRDFKGYIGISIDLNNLEETTEEIVRIKKQIEATLNIVGVGYVTLQPDGLLRLLDGIFNGKCLPKTWNKFEELNTQVLSSDTDIKVEDDVLKLKEGSAEIKTFSISGYPPEWTLYQMGDLIGDLFRENRQFPYPYIIHYGVHIPKQSNGIAKIAVKANLVEKQLRTPIGKYIPDIEKEHAELEFTQQNLAKGERLVQTHFGIILFSPKGEMPSAEQILKTIFSSQLFRVESNKGIHLHSLLTTLPLSWNTKGIKAVEEFKKLRTTISTESSNLVPLQGEWKGTQTPGMILGGRRGQVMTFCPFDNKAGNYNVTVVGRSGAGKSVFMQELMSSTIGLGGRVFVLDVGRSFEKTCYMLEGQFIEFSPHKTICLNPFSGIDPSNEEAVSDALTMLKSVLQLMAAPIKGVDDKGAALLEQAMNESFKELGRETTITHIADYLKSLKDDYAKDLGQMLYPYTKNGAYGKYFDGKANIDLENKLVVIELEELKERKDLQSVVVQMMVINITNKMFMGDRKTPFNIVFDEAWDMLRGNQGGLFIETLARRLRKYRESLVVGTQSVNDFYACAGAQAAWDNSDWNCFLSQKEESIAQLKMSNKILLDSAKEALMTSVKTIHGKYAEVFINGAEGYSVGKLLLDPFSSLLFSTKAEDYAAIQELQKKGMTVAESVEHLLKQRGSDV
jgi:conjugal transfer ATP-binding protein TraC